MTTLASFKIDHLVLTAALDPTDSSGKFQVRSVPRPYDVVCDTQVVPCAAVMEKIKERENTLLFCDAHVANLYLQNLDIPKERCLLMHATEESKTISGVLRLVDFIFSHRLTKADQVLVVGGGIIQDIAAVACALYKRGIPWIYFPTTLLSQCDSCIGGKAGINYGGGKNQLALFSAPAEVVVNTQFLKSLSTEAMASGLGELLKLAITGGSVFVAHYADRLPNGIRNIDVNCLTPLILGSLSVKKTVIEHDEFELNIRQSLNYGHTLGHAIEVLSGYLIPHGQAVAIGMLLANELSHRHDLLSSEDRNTLKNLIIAVLDERCVVELKRLNTAQLLELLQKDKKTKGSVVNFIVPREIGSLEILPMPLNKNLHQTVAELLQEVF